MPQKSEDPSYSRLDQVFETFSRWALVPKQLELLHLAMDCYLRWAMAPFGDDREDDFLAFNSLVHQADGWRPRPLGTVDWRYVRAGSLCKND